MATTLHNAVGTDGKKAPVWAMFIGIGVILVGAAMMFFAKNRSVTIQKGGNTTVSAKRVIGLGAPQQQTVPTANIVAVRLSTYVDRSGDTVGGNPSNSRRSVLSLVLNNNDLIEVGGSGGGGISFNGLNVSSLILKAPLSKEANAAANFLGVPLQADDTSTIAGAVKSLKAAFEQGSTAPPQQPRQPVQPTPFNPTPPPAPTQPVPPAPPAATPPPPVSPMPPAPAAPPQPPAAPSSQVPPPPVSENGPPPPYTPPGSGPAAQ